MDRFIKLPSIEGGNLSASNNRLVFHLPEGAEYKIDDGYINLYTRVSTVDRVSAGGGLLGKQGVHNLEFVYNGDVVLPLEGELFVKNARMRSQRQGILEDTRRVNVLNAYLNHYEQSSEDVEGLRYTTPGQTYNKTQLKENIFREFYKEGTKKSVERLTPIRIPIKKVFRGVSSLPYIPTSVLGGVSVEVELDLANISVANVPHEYPQSLPDGTVPDPAGGSDIVIPAGDYKICDDVSGADTTKLTITTPFPELGYSPYWVGQLIQVHFNKNAGGSFTDVYRTISAISFSDDKKITLTLDEQFDTAPAVAGDNFTSIHIEIDSPHIDYTTVYEYAELLVKEVATPIPREELGMLEYRPFSTEEHSIGSVAGVQNYQKLFYCEPESVNLFVAFGNHLSSHIAGSDGVNDGTYRLAIDNVSLTNRDVEFHTPLHYDLHEKAFRNGELVIRNFNEKVIDQQKTKLTERLLTVAGDAKKLQTIAVPLPVKQSEKLVQVNLNTTRPFNNLILFKQLEKVIKL